MFKDIDLKELTELTAPDRCFLSIYLEKSESIKTVETKISRMSRALNSGEEEKDERTHLDENWKMICDYIKHNPLEKGSVCIFACWLLDFIKVIPLSAKVDDLIWIDSSPYVRPLAELQDEYEDVAVVIADNKKARIFTVSSAVAGDEKVIRGNVKNHVRKGGWSQQRYERRRDKQLLLYGKEIVERLKVIVNEGNISHILLVGGKEILQEIYDVLPQYLQEKTLQKRSDLGKGEESINDDIMELFWQQERESESNLWEKIRREYLRGGLGVVGIEDVFTAVKENKVDKMIVHRNFKPLGCRCRDCENLFIEPLEVCRECSSTSLFEVEVVNELVELVKQQGGETDFADPIDTLTDCGNIAALLRFK